MGRPPRCRAWREGGNGATGGRCFAARKAGRGRCRPECAVAGGGCPGRCFPGETRNRVPQDRGERRRGAVAAHAPPADPARPASAPSDCRHCCAPPGRPREKRSRHGSTSACRRRPPAPRPDPPHRLHSRGKGPATATRRQWTGSDGIINFGTPSGHAIRSSGTLNARAAGGFSAHQHCRCPRRPCLREKSASSPWQKSHCIPLCRGGSRARASSPCRFSRSAVPLHSCLPRWFQVQCARVLPSPWAGPCSCSCQGYPPALPG